MPHYSREDASQTETMEGFEGHDEELGGFTVGFETYAANADITPLFAGLPDDRCQSSHWGVVVRGKVAFATADGEEIIEAGSAYYVPPGHGTRLFAGTEVIEFSPSEDLQRTIAVVLKNMESMGPAT